MRNTQVGKQAETIAAEYLRSRGFLVIDRNWKIPAAEIDIIAKRNGIVYFVEVKYRRSDLYGAGMDYITRSKLSRMQRSASFWVLENSWTGPYHLSAISVTKNLEIDDFVEALII
ncbi:MAG: YraN family protein [Candidatus Saccharimonadales bacterium]|nr:YraN family protein [Candidatus Saccharimonadales bacterium]